MPYQLRLWWEWYIPEVKKELSHPKKPLQSNDKIKSSSEDIFKWFLNRIDMDFRRWVRSIEDIGNKKDAELADKFIQQSNLKKKIPAILAQMGLEKDYRQKFPQYSRHYSMIRKHIKGVLRKYKIRQSQENELENLVTDRVLLWKQKEVQKILDTTKPIQWRIERIRRLITETLVEEHIDRHPELYDGE